MDTFRLEAALSDLSLSNISEVAMVIYKGRKMSTLLQQTGVLCFINPLFLARAAILIHFSHTNVSLLLISGNTMCDVVNKIVELVT